MEVKNIAKKILFKLPEPIIHGFYSLYNFVRYPNMREEKHCYGKINDDRIFYVIRPRTDCIEGLMSLVLNVVKNLHYAESKGYIPVVDFENYETQYRDSSMQEKNTWKFYFEQTSQYELEEVYKSANVVLSGLQALVATSNAIEQSYEPQIIENSRRIIKKYIRINETVEALVAKEENWDLECTLGLYLRGTDYVKLKPAGHPVQPTFEEARKIADEVMERNGLKYVFLVTEDQEIYDEAKAYYGDKLKTVSFDSYISNYGGTQFLGKDNDSISQLSASAYRRGLNYLVKLLLLAKCNSFVGGNTCGSWAACVFAEHFKEQYLFELGRY